MDTRNRDQAVAVDARVGEAAVRIFAAEPEWMICHLGGAPISWSFLDGGGAQVRLAYAIGQGVDLFAWRASWLTVPFGPGLWRGERAPGASHIAWRPLRPAEALRLFYPQLDLGTDDAVRLLRHAARLVEEAKEDLLDAEQHPNRAVAPVLAEDASHKADLAGSLQRLVGLFAPDVRP